MSSRTDQPVYLNIAGKAMFETYPVSRGAQRGARVVQRSSIASHTEGKIVRDNYRTHIGD